MTNIPKIRFKGFSQEWDVKKSGKIFKTKSDKNHADLPVLTATQDKGMVFREDFNSKIQYDLESTINYKKVTINDFVIHLRSFQGGFAHSEIEGITSPAYTVMSFIDNSYHYGYFWKQVFKSTEFINKLSALIYGIRDGKSISFRDFSDIKLIFPDSKEQEKIGNLFKNLDNLIENQEKILENSKAFKKSMLQKMFPSGGKNVPEIRFSGFSHEWEEHVLSEFSKVRGGYAFKSSEYLEEGIPVLRISNINSNGRINDNYIYYPEIENDELFSLYDGDIVLAMSGATTGKIAEVSTKDKIYQNQRVGYFMRSDNINYSFLSTILRSHLFLNQLNDVLVAGAQPNISSKDVENFKFKIPSLPEQEKIGNFFKNLDLKISREEELLDNYKSLKKSLLQKMFV